MTPSLAQGLHHAALCCTGDTNHSSGITNKDASIRIIDRLKCYDYLRTTCRAIRTEGDGLLEAIAGIYRDTPEPDDVEEIMTVTTSARNLLTALNRWGRINQVDCRTGLPNPYYTREGVSINMGDADSPKVVHPTQEQIDSLNKICVRYQKSPESISFETKADENGNFVPSTLFAVWPFIVIGIEPDGHAHS